MEWAVLGVLVTLAVLSLGVLLLLRCLAAWGAGGRLVSLVSLAQGEARSGEGGAPGWQVFLWIGRVSASVMYTRSTNICPKLTNDLVIEFLQTSCGPTDLLLLFIAASSENFGKCSPLSPIRRDLG